MREISEMRPLMRRSSKSLLSFCNSGFATNRNNNGSSVLVRLSILSAIVFNCSKRLWVILIFFPFKKAVPRGGGTGDKLRMSHFVVYDKCRKKVQHIKINCKNDY